MQNAESRSTTYRLVIEFDTTTGHHMYANKSVDTVDQALALAREGHRMDVLDGLQTTYRLLTWCNYGDRSELADVVVLDD